METKQQIYKCNSKYAKKQSNKQTQKILKHESKVEHNTAAICTGTNLIYQLKARVLRHEIFSDIVFIQNYERSLQYQHINQLPVFFYKIENLI